MDSSELVRGCIENNVIAQKQLYDCYAKKMMGVCLRYASNYDDAQDMLQDGFVKVFRNLTSYRGSGSFEGWIRKIIVNTALEHLRKKKALMFAVDIYENGHQLPSNDMVMASINRDELLKMIQQMPLGYRVVFNMYAIEGYSHKEIADRLNISEGTSKSQYSRARAFLQKQLQQEKAI